MIEGTVKWFNASKGFGLLSTILSERGRLCCWLRPLTQRSLMAYPFVPARRRWNGLTTGPKPSCRSTAQQTTAPLSYPTVSRNTAPGRYPVKMRWAIAALVAVACSPQGGGSRRTQHQETCAGLAARLRSASDESVRAAAARDLGDLRQDSECAARVLVEAVRDDEGYLVADAALRALGQLGPAAASATDDLILMDRGGKPPLNPDLLVETLVKMGPVTIPRLVFHLRLSASPGDEEAFGRGGLAERVLGQLGRDAVRPLIQVLQDPDRRDGAARALENLGPTAIDAAPALMELYEEEGAPKIIIIQAIYNMGKDACVARHFLGRLAVSKAPEVQGYVRAEVEDALRNLQGCPGR